MNPPGVGVAEPGGTSGGSTAAADTAVAVDPAAGPTTEAAVGMGRADEGLKSSSMSRTLASSDFEDLSLRSNSFILFCIMIVFLVIFSPGRAMRRNQGIHWRKTVRT